MEIHCKIEHHIPQSQNLAHAVWRVETLKHGVMEFKFLNDATGWVEENYFNGSDD